MIDKLCERERNFKTVVSLFFPRFLFLLCHASKIVTRINSKPSNTPSSYLPNVSKHHNRFSDPSVQKISSFLRSIGILHVDTKQLLEMTDIENEKKIRKEREASGFRSVIWEKGTWHYEFDDQDDFGLVACLLTIIVYGIFIILYFALAIPAFAIFIILSTLWVLGKVIWLMMEPVATKIRNLWSDYKTK